MVSKSDIKKDMEVRASDGKSIGRVDEVEDKRIKITREGSPDGQHHYVDYDDIASVDDHIHLTKTHAELHAAGAGAASGAGTAAGAAVPPIRNPAVTGAEPRRNYLLPWVLGGLALLALILALTQCDRDGDRNRTDAVAVETPRVVGAPLREGSLAYDVDRFLASEDGVPRTFTLDRINFDSGTAALREDDRNDLDDLARVFAAHPEARAAVVGYTDAAGPASTNRELGAERARAVVTALSGRGIDSKRLEARTGGEANPTSTNASSPDRFENRRTELVLLRR